MTELADLGNLVTPPEAPAMVVVAGDAASEASLGRMASDLERARLATFLLHVDRHPRAARGSPPDSEPSGGALGEAIRLLGEHSETAHLDIGVLAVGKAARTALAVASERPGLVSALVAYDARLGPGADAAARVHVPTLLLVEDERLVPETSTALDLIPGEKELQVLHAARRSDEERTERMLAAAIAWFGHHLASGGDYPRTT